MHAAMRLLIIKVNAFLKWVVEFFNIFSLARWSSSVGLAHFGQLQDNLSNNS